MDLASVLTLALLAFFLAVQPWSLLAAILLVTSTDGVKKESAYVAGWLTALTVVAAVTVAFYPGVQDNSKASTTQSAVTLATGVILGGLLLMRWRKPQDPGTASQPSWMGRLDTMSRPAAFGLGAFLPTYAAVVAAVSQMLSSGLTQGWLMVAAVLWVLTASAGVASPLFVLVTDRSNAPATYQRWRAWIVANSRTILYAVGGLVSVVLIAKGIVELLD